MMITPTATGRQGLAVESRLPAKRRAARRSQSAELRVFKASLPETFNVSVTKPEWAAYACWVVSTIVRRRFIDKHADETTFVPMSSEYIDKHIPPKVRRELLDDLIGAGVLECDGIYYFGNYTGRQARRHIPGGPGKCLYYRLGAAHWGEKIGARDITHRELLRKIARAWQNEREEVTDPAQLTLRDWHDRVEVLPTAPYGIHPLLDVMIDGERRFKVCDQGRIHTNVANLPRQFRQFLRLDGRELTSCDISTSQPLILAILLRYRREAEEREGRKQRRNHNAVFHLWSDASLSDYLQDCLGGSVYDKVASLSGYTRDDVKQKFLAVVYGHPDDMHTKVGKAIRQLYPAVFHAVVALYAELGHGGLARLMQTMESDVMIRRVAARLLHEHPTMPLLTVHDCVLVPAEHVEVAKQVIAQEWMAEFGVAPRVKTSVFTDPQTPRPKGNRRRRKGPLSRFRGAVRPVRATLVRMRHPNNLPAHPLRGSKTAESTDVRP